MMGVFEHVQSIQGPPQASWHLILSFLPDDVPAPAPAPLHIGQGRRGWSGAHHFLFPSVVFLIQRAGAATDG